MNQSRAARVESGNATITADAPLHKGDVVLLQAGDLVPADLKLLEARGLLVDEWELTGEIVPAEKQVAAEDVFVYKGSRVVRGSGKGLVVATGEETEYAAILKQPWERDGYERPALVKSKSLLLLLVLLPPIVVALSRGANPGMVSLAGGLTAVVVVLLQNRALFKHALLSGGVRHPHP